MLGLFAIMLLYGVGMVIVLLYSGETVALRMVGAFSAMFAGVLGFGSGYLLGSRNGNGNGNGNTH
jgi:hypothetical protein